MDELGGAGVADAAYEIALAQNASFFESGCGRLKVSEDQKILAQPRRFTNGVQRDDRIAEQRAHVRDRRVAFLMVEGQHADRRVAGLRQIDAAVAHRAQRGAAALSIVGRVEVVAADDRVACREAGRRGVTVGVVVDGTVG